MCIGVVLSPCYGIVEKVSIKSDIRIYEWEPLFQIKTTEGKVEMIQTGLSGEVESSTGRGLCYSGDGPCFY